MKYAAAALICALLTGCEALAPPTPAASTPDAPLRVVEVLDGDTLRVETSTGDRVRVRVLGIDAPEEAKDDVPAECGASEARDALAALVDDQRVGLTTDARSDTEDRYGRRLAYVDVDGLDVGNALIEAGMAAAWHPRTAPAPERWNTYLAAQLLAQDAGKGLWATCPAIGR